MSYFTTAVKFTEEEVEDDICIAMLFSSRLVGYSV